MVGTMYTRGTNMYPLGVNKFQKCTFWKDTTPVTAFVPFFLRVHNRKLGILGHGEDICMNQSNESLTNWIIWSGSSLRTIQDF